MTAHLQCLETPAFDALVKTSSIILGLSAFYLHILSSIKSPNTIVYFHESQFHQGSGLKAPPLKRFF